MWYLLSTISNTYVSVSYTTRGFPNLPPVPTATRRPSSQNVTFQTVSSILKELIFTNLLALSSLSELSTLHKENILSLPPEATISPRLVTSTEQTSERWLNSPSKINRSFSKSLSHIAPSLQHFMIKINNKKDEPRSVGRGLLEIFHDVSTTQVVVIFKRKINTKFYLSPEDDHNIKAFNTFI